MTPRIKVNHCRPNRHRVSLRSFPRHYIFDVSDDGPIKYIRKPTSIDRRCTGVRVEQPIVSDLAATEIIAFSKCQIPFIAKDKLELPEGGLTDSVDARRRCNSQDGEIPVPPTFEPQTEVTPLSQAFSPVDESPVPSKPHNSQGVESSEVTSTLSPISHAFSHVDEPPVLSEPFNSQSVESSEVILAPSQALNSSTEATITNDLITTNDLIIHNDFTITHGFDMMNDFDILNDLIKSHEIAMINDIALNKELIIHEDFWDDWLVSDLGFTPTISHEHGKRSWGIFAEELDDKPAKVARIS